MMANIINKMANVMLGFYLGVYILWEQLEESDFD